MELALCVKRKKATSRETPNGEREVKSFRAIAQIGFEIGISKKLIAKNILAIMYRYR